MNERIISKWRGKVNANLAAVRTGPAICRPPLKTTPWQNLFHPQPQNSKE